MSKIFLNRYILKVPKKLGCFFCYRTTAQFFSGDGYLTVNNECTYCFGRGVLPIPLEELKS